MITTRDLIPEERHQFSAGTGEPIWSGITPAVPIPLSCDFSCRQRRIRKP
jgi:hypothetical protein